MFWDLDAGRAVTEVGPQPISWADVAAWSHLTGVQPDPWEIKAIYRLDYIRLTHGKKDEQAASAGSLAAAFGGKS